MEDKWSTDLNADLNSKYDSIGSTLIGGAVAATVDFGATVWNSLPFTPEVSTYDLLERIDSNALAVYNENRTAVETASFIGGVFVPAGLALKGMNAARTGVKGVGWFNKAGQRGMASRIQKLYEAGPEQTGNYRRLVRQYYGRGVAHGVADAVAMEMAILATMNAHPFMEDYLKDPVKHFGISLALGGVVGGGINHIADRAVMKGIRGKAQSSAWGQITDAMRSIEPGLPQINKLQMQAANIETLEAIRTMQGSNALVKGFAEDMLLLERTNQAADFKRLAGSVLQGVPDQYKADILNRLATETKFLGVDAVDLLRFKPAEASKIQKWKPVESDAEPLLRWAKDPSRPTVAYHPEFDAFTTLQEARNFARAPTIGVTKQNLMSGIGDFKTAIMVPDHDAAMVLAGRGSAEVDRIYLQRLAFVDSLDPKVLAKAAIAPDDIASISALVAKFGKHPDAMDGVKIRLTKQQINWDNVQQAIVKHEGVKAEHWKKLTEAARESSPYNLGRANLVSDTRQFLKAWTAGDRADIAKFRMAVVGFRQKGWTPGNHADMIREMYESSASRNLRDMLKREVATPDGDIYLYRGLKTNKPTGHAPVESFTPNASVGTAFGKTKMYKVHVDDILGVVDNGHGEFEYLVMSPARQTAAELPIQGKAGQLLPMQQFTTTSELYTGAQLMKHLAELKEEAINALAKQGAPIEVIAIRTNTPADTIKAYIGSAKTKSLEELATEGLPYMSYRDAGAIDEYLSPLLQPMVLRSNKNKVPYAELSAAADVRALDIADREIKAMFLMSSPSETARAVGDLFFSEQRRPLLDMLRAGVSKAVEGYSGLKFIQSTDFYVRMMGDFGKIASVVGKDVQHVSNMAVKRILAPMTQEMNAVARKPEALIEFNTAIAANASLKGKRIYEDRTFKQAVKGVDEAGKEVTTWEPILFQGKQLKIVSDEVDSLLTHLAAAGREMYHLKNTGNKILGIKPLTDMGFWVPAFNPVGKHIKYVWNKLDDTTSILWGNTLDELKDAEAAFRGANARALAEGTMDIVDRGQAQLHSVLNGRADPLTMQVANVEKLHSGASTPAIVKANVDIFTDISQSYEHYLQAAVRNLADMSMSDITGTLMKMSKATGLESANQPLTTVQKWISRKEDPAQIMRNTLLGINNVNQAPAWQAINQGFETVVGVSLEKVREAWHGVLQGLPSGLRKKVLAGEETKLLGLNYEELATRLERAGIHNPWKIFDDKAAEMFGVAKLSESKNVTPRMVFAGNALAATTVLRFGEIAQPVVNAISLPILSMGAIAERLPATFMGVQKGTASVPPLQAMTEGVRAAFSNNPMHQRWAKAWEKAGYFDPIVSEATDVLRLGRAFEPGAVAKVEQALDSNLVRIMSKPADYSEAMVRRIGMFTGGNLAKRLYPELDDVGVTIFARDFMDKVVGNYHAAQRPTMFQGSMGAAMSLFQTYMLSMAQRIYGHLEMRDFKALGKMMLTQASIFGTGSLPGFNPISQMIGEHFSDNNVDLITGTYRAIPDKMANVLLYGMPSSMGPAMYSRGELAPRGPTTIGEFPSVSIATQAVQSVMSVARAVGSDVEDVPRAIGQALSMQSISRPLARTSELVTGYSVTRQGNTIAVPEEVWTVTGVLSRMMTTRPLEEAKLRDAIHLDRVYGSIDRRKRQKATAELRTAIRNKTLSDDKLHRIAEQYLRTGSPQGWRAAVTEAIMTTNTSGREVFLNKLQPDNPFMHMIDQMDGPM